MILMTTRIGTFDEASHFRINLVVYFNRLNEEARRQVWLRALATQKCIQSEENADDYLDSEVLDSKLNGHTIINVVELASRCAKAHNRNLMPVDIRLALTSFRNFEAYLSETFQGISPEKRAMRNQHRADTPEVYALEEL